jgi:hypothetical protein
MRRATTATVLTALASLVLASSASAAPKVTLKAEAVPIPGFAHTGNIFGAGAAVKAEYTISGTEYGGFPPPLIGVTFSLPSGTKLHPKGFPTCRPAVLEPSGPGPRGCPRDSRAGPVGKVLGIVSFGSERVSEAATLESFYAPGGGLLFFTAGHSPVSLEILSRAHYVNLGGGAGFGPKLIAEVPLVETVPGAPDASVLKISVKVGSAMRRHGKPVYYGTMPKTCPKHFLLGKSELTFAGLGGLTQVTVPVKYKARCPRRH